MTGLQMLLKAMGVEVDPVELTHSINDAKERIPQMAAQLLAAAESIDRRLSRLEMHLGIVVKPPMASLEVTNGRTNADADAHTR